MLSLEPQGASASGALDWTPEWRFRVLGYAFRQNPGGGNTLKDDPSVKVIPYVIRRCDFKNTLRMYSSTRRGKQDMQDSIQSQNHHRQVYSDLSNAMNENLCAEIFLRPSCTHRSHDPQPLLSSLHSFLSMPSCIVNHCRSTTKPSRRPRNGGIPD